jgi:hypothetical protein
MIKSIARAAKAVTPSNTAYLTDLRGIQCTGTLYIGVSGDVVVLPAEFDNTDSATPANGGAVLYKSVPVGFFPVEVRKVFDTGTTATNIVCQFD